MKKNITGQGRQERRISRKDVTVGCDPEFELIGRDGAIHEADRIILEGTGANIEIGVDGSGSPVELRPRPSHMPETVVRNIKNLLKRFTRSYPGYKLSYDGHRFSVGGHIHSGVRGVTITDYMARVMAQVMDDFIGKLVLPLAGWARRGSSYNTLTKYRIQPWGFEYRTPPAAVFANPRMAKLCMKACRMICFTFMNKKRFSYQDPPTVADYKNICHFTAAEHDEFKTLCSQLSRDSDKDLMAKWGVAVVPYRRQRRSSSEVASINRIQEVAAQTPLAPQFNISFSDDWDAARRHQIESGLRAMFTPTTLSINLDLFGLRADRGHVTAGIILTGADCIEHPNAGWQSGTRTLRIGLPYDFRMDSNGLCQDLLRVVALLVDSLNHYNNQA